MSQDILDESVRKLPPKSQTQDVEVFARRFLTLLLLFVGLNVFNTVSLTVLPFFIDDFGLDMYWFVGTSPGIGRVIFGLIIFMMSREYGRAAISVGILSAMMPLFGSVLYLLMITLKSETNE